MWIAELKTGNQRASAAASGCHEPLARQISRRAEQIPAWIAELKPTVEEPAEPLQNSGEVHTENWLIGCASSVGIVHADDAA
jgi:hypothetical protein